MKIKSIAITVLTLALTALPASAEVRQGMPGCRSTQNYQCVGVAND